MSITMQELPVIHSTPEWSSLAIVLGVSIGVAFIIALIAKSRLRCRTAPASNSSFWTWLAVASGLLVFVALAFVSTTGSHVEVISARPEIVLRDRTLRDVEAPIPTIPQIPSLPAASEPQIVFPARLAIGKAFVLLAGCFGVLAVIALLSGWSRRRSSVVATAPAPATQPKSGLGWLIVPTACLAGLIAVAAPKLVPTSRPASWALPAVSLSQQERMDKALRDLAATSSSTTVDGKPLATWITTKPIPKEYVRLTSGQYSTRQEGEDELLPIAADLLQRSFHEWYPWQGQWKVPLAQVRERVVEHEYVEHLNKTIGDYELYRVHWLLYLSPEVCETFADAWKAQIVEQRLKILGVLLAWMSGVFLLGGSFYRAMATPGFSYQWAATMKVSMMTVGLTALAGWVLMTFIP